MILSFIAQDRASARASVPAPARPAAPPSTLIVPGAGSTFEIYLAIALSGLAALGAEVVWTRLLSLLLGGTVYTFSIILAVFLVGLGAGSSVGAMLTKSGINARLALAWCQVLCAIGIGWTAYSVTNGMPNWPIDPRFSLDPHFGYPTRPRPLLLGNPPADPVLECRKSFPLALAAVASVTAAQNKKGGDPAGVVGRVYAANTVGAIFGALLFSLIFIPKFGTQNSEHILIGIVALAAIVAILPTPGPYDHKK